MQQTTVQVLPGGGVAISGAQGNLPMRPLTNREIDAIRERRSDISNQLTSAMDRRENMIEEMSEAPAEAKQGYLEQIQVLEKQMDGVRERLAKQADVRYQELTIRADRARQALDEHRATMMQHNEASVSYNIIKTETETKKGILKQLLERQSQADLNNSGPTRNNVSVTDIAQVPGWPALRCGPPVPARCRPGGWRSCRR